MAHPQNQKEKTKKRQGTDGSRTGQPHIFFGMEGENVTIKNPAGESFVLQSGMSASDDRKMIYNNPNAKEKNWDYAKWNDDINDYEFHTSKNQKEEPFSMLLKETPSISENLPWSDLIGLGADKFEQNYDRLMQYQKARQITRSLGIPSGMTDNQFGRYYDSKLLKNSVGSIALKSLGTSLEAIDFVKSGMNMNKGVQGDLSVPLPPQMMPINLITQMLTKDQSKKWDLRMLEDAIKIGSKEVSNQLNNSMGVRLNLKAGFADSTMMLNILKRGEVDLSQDRLQYIKHLGTFDSPDLGDRKFPFLIVHPRGESKTKDFFILTK